MAALDRIKGFLRIGSSQQSLYPENKALPPGSTYSDYLFQYVGSQTVPPKRGTKQILEVYSESPWIRTIVNKIGKAVGDTNWRLYKSLYARDEKDGNDYVERIAKSPESFRRIELKRVLDINKVKEIHKHPLLDLLEYGNEQMLGKVVIQLTTQYIDLVGEAFILMEKNIAGTPVALWPIPPHWVKSIPTETYPFFTVSADVSNKSQIEIPATEIIWIKEFDPADPYKRGTGIARSLGDEIETDEYASKYVKNFFYNNAKPNVIISGESINREDSRRLEQKWKDEHTGFMNAFKPLFFSRKIDIKELQGTLENMQMTQIRNLERDTIQQVYNLPPETLGIIGDSTRSTILSADFFLQKNIINPRCEQIRCELQRHLVPYFGYNLILNYDSPIMEDRDYKLKVMQQGTWAFTVNDWRAEANMPTLGEEGEVLIVPLNQGIVPADELTKFKVGMESSNVSPIGGDKKPAKTIVVSSEDRKFLQDLAEDLSNKKDVPIEYLKRAKFILGRK